MYGRLPSSQVRRNHPAWAISIAVSYSYYCGTVLDKVLWDDISAVYPATPMQSESPQRRCQHTSIVPCCCCVGSLRWRWPGEQLFNSEQSSSTSLRFVVADDGDGDGVLWRELVACRDTRYHRCRNVSRSVSCILHVRCAAVTILCTVSSCVSWSGVLAVLYVVRRNGL